MKLPTFEYGCFGGAKYQGGDETEARGTDEQPLSDKPHWYHVEKLTMPDSSNLRAQDKVCVK